MSNVLDPALELLADDRGRCAGAVLYDLAHSRPVLACAGATVLATGGAGRLHLAGFPTSNHFGAMADGLVMAYRLGAKLREVDSFQYHPTGIAWPSHMEGALVSEAARSAGAFLVNGKGERFIDELQPRDVVASAVLREIAEGRGIERDGKVGIFLDTPTLEQRQPGILDDRLVTLSHLAHRCGINPALEPLLIRPTLHYQNGGVAIDTAGRTSVSGLLCAGEMTGGLHGSKPHARPTHEYATGSTNALPHATNVFGEWQARKHPGLQKRCSPARLDMMTIKMQFDQIVLRRLVIRFGFHSCYRLTTTRAVSTRSSPGRHR